MWILLFKWEPYRNLPPWWQGKTLKFILFFFLFTSWCCFFINFFFTFYIWLAYLFSLIHYLFCIALFCYTHNDAIKNIPWQLQTNEKPNSVRKQSSTVNQSAIVSFLPSVSYDDSITRIADGPPFCAFCESEAKLEMLVLYEFYTVFCRILYPNLA